MGSVRKIVIGYCLVAMMGCGDTPPSANSATLAEPGDIASAPAASLEGYIRVSIDGTVRDFDLVPTDRNFVTSLASTFTAQMSSTPQTTFVITVLSVDLKALSYPVSLLPDRSSDNPKLALGSIGYAYINEEGIEWAGPGKISLDSFEDGHIRGSFSEVSLPHTDKTLPNVIVTQGEFQIQI